MSPTVPTPLTKKTLAALVVIAILGLITFGVKQYQNRQKVASITVASNTPNTISASQSISQPDTSSPTNASSSTKFKNGTYTASSDYRVPPGTENIKVTLTIKNGVVTDSVVQNSGTNPVSAEIQAGFTTEYKSQVIGKKISGLQIAFIAGASDTSQGFDDALLQIQSQAQV